jgi:hypothetical protein
LAVAAAAAGALVATGGVGLAGPGALPGDSAYGGGRHALGTCTDGTTPFCPPGGREFSLVANATRAGRSGDGSFEYANPTSGAVILSGDVTCLEVDGEQAVVGGRVNEGPTTGAGFLFYIEDRGRPGSAIRDRISPVFVLAPDEEPPGFPRRCPSFEEDVEGVGYFESTYGDVAVIDN